MTLGVYQSIDSIIALRAFSAPISTPYGFSVEGYNSIGDRGGGTFDYVASDTVSGALFTGSAIPIAAPSTAPTLTSTPGGSLAAATYYVTVTYITTSGETVASSEANLAVSANNLLVVNSPALAAGVTGYNVYVSTSTGTETKQNVVPVAIGVSWTEPTLGLANGGRASPSSGTAGSVLTISSVVSGALAIGQSIGGTGIPSNVWITGKISGTSNYVISAALTISPGASITADNGGTIIVDQAGRRWHRSVSSVVDLSMWGFYDNTGTLDATYALGAALNAAPNVVGCGSYLLSGPVNIPGSVEL